MVSEYLKREVRDRLTITCDLALTSEGDWGTLSAIADGLDVLFAVSTYGGDDHEARFVHVSNSSWVLTGYWANELIDKSIDILFTPETDMVEFRRFEAELLDNGEGEIRFVARRKNGDVFGCHLVAREVDKRRTNRAPSFMAFMAACPLGECSRAALPCA